MITTAPVANFFLAIGRFLLNILVPISLCLPAVAGIGEVYGKDPTTLVTGDWLKFSAGVLGSLVGVLVYVANRKNEINHVSGLAKGQKDMLRRWEVGSRGLISAATHLGDALGRPRSQREADGRMAVREAVVCVRKIVATLFDGVDEDRLTVTLGMPMADGRAMRIVSMTPPRGNRSTGSVYTFPPDDGELHSMLRAFRRKEPVYTSDCHQIEGMEDKRYRSILSLPVLNRTRDVIAVVNVDGEHADMYSVSQHDEPGQSAFIIANELAQPALKLIVFALEQCAPFDAELR